MSASRSSTAASSRRSAACRAQYSASRQVRSASSGWPGVLLHPGRLGQRAGLRRQVAEPLGEAAAAARHSRSAGPYWPRYAEQPRRSCRAAVAWSASSPPGLAQGQRAAVPVDGARRSRRSR